MALDSKIYLSFVNAIANCTLSSNRTISSTHPLVNLHNQVRSKPCRADMTGLTSIQYKGTTSTAFDANMLGLQNFNWDENVTVQLQLYSDTAWTTELYDSNDDNGGSAFNVRETIPWGEAFAGITPWAGQYDELVNLAPNFMLGFDIVRDVKSFIVTVTTTDTFTNDISSLDKLHLGWGWTPSKNIEIGSSFGTHDKSVSQEMMSGGRRSTIYPSLRQLELFFHALSDTDAGVLSYIFNQVGFGRDLAVMLNPSDTGFSKIMTGGIFQRYSNISQSVIDYQRNDSFALLREN